MSKITRMYAIIGGWGIIAAIIGVISLSSNRVSEPTILKTFLAIITAAIIFFAGRTAKQGSASPAGVGAISGVIYGIASGWSSLFIHETRAEYVTSLKSHHLTTTVNTATALKFANSPDVHIAIWLIVIAAFALIGLVFGAIGGATAKKPGYGADV